MHSNKIIDSLFSSPSSAKIGTICFVVLATAAYFYDWKKTTTQEKELLSHLKCENETDPALKFQEIASKHPNKVAIKYRLSEDYTYDLTFKELDDESSEIAAFLIKHVKPKNNIIGVSVQDKKYAVIYQLAALKAGIAFFPLDLRNTPTEKLAAMINKLKLDWVIASNGDGYPDALPDVNLIRDCSGYITATSHKRNGYIHEEKRDLQYQRPLDLNITRLVYILPTSGSTSNEPKLVKQHALALAGQSANYKQDIGFSENDTFLQIAPLTHDQSIVDIYGALLNGCTLCMYDLQGLNFQVLQEFIIKNEISVFSSIPSMFMRIFETMQPDSITKPMYIVLGGEELNESQFTLFKSTFPKGSYFFNYHGASECSLTLFSKLSHDSTLNGSVPLGKPTAKLQIILLSDPNDPELKELCIHSPYMSTGYFGNSEYTANAFVKINGELYYKTGDIVTVDEHGTYHFKGRKVWYEKIDGKRIDLHEIENNIYKIAHVKEAAVVCHGEGNHKHLYAFYSSSDNIEIPHIRQNYTANVHENHLIPKAFIFMKDLPKLSNGKINRNELKQLLAKNVFAIPVEAMTDEELSTLPIKEAVARIWHRELDAEYIPNSDINFTEVGGTSMIAMRIINSITAYYATKYKQVVYINVPAIYNSPTLFKFYSQLEKADKESYIVDRTPATKFDLTRAGVYSKEYQALQFSVEGYKAAAAAYSAKLNVSIEILNYRKELVMRIKECITQNAGSALKQFGFITPIQHDVPNGHPTACILSLNNHTGAPIIFISDSIATGGQHNKEFHALLKKEIPNCKVLIDKIARQSESQSCQVFALMWTKSALKIDLAKKVILDPTDATAFYSPPELLKTAHIGFYAYKNYIKWDTPLEGDKKNRSLRDFITENTKEVTLQNPSNQNRAYKHMFNTYIYSKTEKLFKAATDGCARKS